MPAVSSSVARSPAPKRGRPARRWMTIDEVAEALAWDAAALARALDRCPGLLEGALKGESGWEVPERALRELLRAKTGALPAMCSVAEAAAFIGRSDKWVYKLMSVRGPDGAALLPSRVILGEYRLLVEDVLKLPPAYPDWAAPVLARPVSFFSSQEDSTNG